MRRTDLHASSHDQFQPYQPPRELSRDRISQSNLYQPTSYLDDRHKPPSRAIQSQYNQQQNRSNSIHDDQSRIGGDLESQAQGNTSHLNYSSLLVKEKQDFNDKLNRLRLKLNGNNNNESNSKPTSFLKDSSDHLLVSPGQKL